MKDVYSKWLLVSDIDGTLNNKAMNLPDNNRISIGEFVAKGGNFTLCSGRNLESLSIHYKKLGVKTPAIFLNGAGIYDFSTESILSYTPITDEGVRIILDIYKKYKLLNLTVFSADKIYLANRKCIYGYAICKIDGLSYELCKKTEEIPNGIWGKVSFFGLPSLLKKIQKVLENDENSKFLDCFFTSPLTLEVVRAGVNKGYAVEKLAGILNIDMGHTAAIGDYYNDVKMLEIVSHPACCGQAPDDIKGICEYVTCHCNNGAVADFINYLETNYIK